MALALALLAMQAAGLPEPAYTDVARATDGTVYAVDMTQIRKRVSAGVPIRTGSIRVTFSQAANAATEEVVRSYRIRCDARTAALHTALSMERGTRRVSMTSAKLAELEYLPIDRMDPAEKTAIEFICAAPL